MSILHEPGREDEISVPIVDGAYMEFKLCTLALPRGAHVVAHTDGDCWGVFHNHKFMDSFSTFVEAWVAGALMPVRSGHGPH